MWNVYSWIYDVVSLIKDTSKDRMSPQKWEKLRYKRSSEYANAKNKLIKATKAKANSNRVVVSIF